MLDTSTVLETDQVAEFHGRPALPIEPEASMTTGEQALMVVKLDSTTEGVVGRSGAKIVTFCAAEKRRMLQEYSVVQDAPKLPLERVIAWKGFGKLVAPIGKLISREVALSQEHNEPVVPDENDSKLEHGHEGAVNPPKSVAILKRTIMLPPLSEKSAMVMNGAGIKDGA